MAYFWPPTLNRDYLRIYLISVICPGPRECPFRYSGHVEIPGYPQDEKCYEMPSTWPVFQTGCDYVVSTQVVALAKGEA